VLSGPLLRPLWCQELIRRAHRLRSKLPGACAEAAAGERQRASRQLLFSEESPRARWAPCGLPARSGAPSADGRVIPSGQLPCGAARRAARTALAPSKLAVGFLVTPPDRSHQKTSSLPCGASELRDHVAYGRLLAGSHRATLAEHSATLASSLGWSEKAGPFEQASVHSCVMRDAPRSLSPRREARAAGAPTPVARWPSGPSLRLSLLPGRPARKTQAVYAGTPIWEPLSRTPPSPG